MAARSLRLLRGAATAGAGLGFLVLAAPIHAEPEKGGKPELLGHPRHVIADLLGGDGKLFSSAFPTMDPARARKKLGNMMLFAGTANPSLADEVAYELSQPLGKINVSRFADGEVGVQVMDNVRGKDCYVIQSTSQPVNENLVELLLTITALRRASAGSITACIPYYGAWARGPRGVPWWAAAVRPLCGVPGEVRPHDE